ncbi:hypothetical protein BGZ79_006120, partial [Entomortierella chlamydospora]
MSFPSRCDLDRYIGALQNVVDRHDILRTAIMWKNLSTPAQVVLRKARLSVKELSLDPINGSILDQMSKIFDPREFSVDLTKAPLIQLAVAQDTDKSWIVVELMHHLIGDHSTLDVMTDEIKANLDGRGDSLPPPQPFRNLIAQARSGP